MRHEVHQQCLLVTSFGNRPAPCCAPFHGRLYSTPFYGRKAATRCVCSCGNATANHGVGVPTRLQQSALGWFATTVPNAAHQPCADEIAAVAPATGHCPSSGAPSQKQGEFKATQCEHGRCAPPSLSLCTLSQHVQHELIAWSVQGTFQSTP